MINPQTIKSILSTPDTPSTSPPCKEKEKLDPTTRGERILARYNPDTIEKVISTVNDLKSTKLF